MFVQFSIQSKLGDWWINQVGLTSKVVDPKSYTKNKKLKKAFLQSNKVTLQSYPDKKYFYYVNIDQHPLQQNWAPPIILLHEYSNLIMDMDTAVPMHWDIQKAQRAWSLVPYSLFRKLKVINYPRSAVVWQVEKTNVIGSVCCHKHKLN